MREQFIECARHLSAPRHRAPPPPVVGKSHVLATTAARATEVLRWYSGGTRGGTPGGQCGAAVFRRLSTASTANLSHIVNTIISCAATRAWRRDQTGNKVWGTSRTCLTQEIDAMFNCKHCMYLKVLETRDDEQFYAMVESGLYFAEKECKRQKYISKKFKCMCNCAPFMLNM